MRIYILLLLISTALWGNQVNTVLDASLKENDLSSDAVLILEHPMDSKDIFLSYNKDLVILTLKNTMMVKKRAYPKATDKRILRTLVHSPSLNRVDYRLRFKNSKLVKPSLNDIVIKKNRVIVKFFKSQKDMLLFKLQEKNTKKMEAKKENKEVVKKTVAKVEKTTESEKTQKRLEKVTGNVQKADNTKEQEAKTLIASPAPSSFNSTILVLLAFLGAIAFYLKKRNPIASVATEGVKILSTKSLGNKKQIVMIEANGNKMLLATSDNGVQVLSDLDGKPSEEAIEYQPKVQASKKVSNFKTELDEEIEELEQSFFQKKTKKNPYVKEEEPEVVTHFSNKLKNIRKL